MIVYNLWKCDRQLRLLHDQAVSYETLHAILPFHATGGERDDQKRAVFMLLKPPLSAMGVELLAIREPRDVLETGSGADDAEAFAIMECETPAEEEPTLCCERDRLEVWCDDALSAFETFVSNPLLLDLQPFHRISAVDPKLVPASTFEW